jgi:hypothetical protein
LSLAAGPGPPLFAKITLVPFVGDRLIWPGLSGLRSFLLFSCGCRQGL